MKKLYIKGVLTITQHIQVLHALQVVPGDLYVSNQKGRFCFAPTLNELNRLETLL